MAAESIYEDGKKGSWRKIDPVLHMKDQDHDRI